MKMNNNYDNNQKEDTNNSENIITKKMQEEIKNMKKDVQSLLSVTYVNINNVLFYMICFRVFTNVIKEMIKRRLLISPIRETRIFLFHPFPCSR